MCPFLEHQGWIFERCQVFPSHASAFRMPLKVWCSFEVLRALWKCLSKRSQEVSQAPQGQLFPTQQLQTALRSERSKCPLEAGVLSHSGKGCFHWGSGNVELPCYIPPIQGKESSVKCEMGINHIYSSQETWDTCLETHYHHRTGSVPSLAVEGCWHGVRDGTGRYGKAAAD